MFSSPFQSDHGSLLDFDHTGTRVLGDPDYPFEAALRLGVPISERGLLMGREERKLGPQSALLNAKVQPSGMYGVRTSSLPVMAEAERQSMGVLPQTSRMMGALSRPPPVLVEPKASMAAEVDGTFRSPWMNVKEAKRDEATARAFATVQDQTREVRQGLAEAGARYGTSFVPPSSIYGLPDPGNQNWLPKSRRHPKSRGQPTESHQTKESLGEADHPGQMQGSDGHRHLTAKGIITNPGPPVPINAATMATLQAPGTQGTFGTWTRGPHELGQGFHQPAPTKNLYGGFQVEAAYPTGAVQNAPMVGSGGDRPASYSAYAPPGPTIQSTLADPLAIYRQAQAREAAHEKKSSVTPHHPLRPHNQPQTATVSTGTGGQGISCITSPH